MTDTYRELAERARQLAAAAPNGSLERKAYGCAAVALSTTGTLGAARRVLGFVRQVDVQAAAIRMVDVLVEGAAEAADTDLSPDGRP